MLSSPVKEKIIRYVLMSLIIGFFLIPFFALCYHDRKIFPGLTKFASILLFFFH